MSKLSNLLASEGSQIPEQSWKKDTEAFLQGSGPCYWVDEVSYTRADFVRVTNGDVSLGEHLFSHVCGLSPQQSLYVFVNESMLHLPDYDAERSILSFYEPPLPIEAHQRLLEVLGWEPLFPEFPYPRLWTHQFPNASVPPGIAFVDLLKRSETEARREQHKGKDDE